MSLHEHKPDDGEFRSILIYGMGMMGASLAHALRHHSSARVAGVVRSDSSAAFLRGHNLADEVLVIPDEEAAAGLDLGPYDLIVLGTPVSSVLKLAGALSLSSFRGILTDMSSTRRDVQAAFAGKDDVTFVGSHPMCGSEDRGPQAAVPELFLNRLCILTPLQPDERPHLPEAVYASALARVESFWQSLGMKTFVLDADDHDEVLAYLSHGPHLISSLLSLWAESPAVLNAGERAPMPITGGGFKGMARIAGSNPEMWTAILQSNRDHLRAAMRGFRAQLDALIDDLDKALPGDADSERWQEWFRRARLARNRLCGYPEDE